MRYHVIPVEWLDGETFDAAIERACGIPAAGAKAAAIEYIRQHGSVHGHDDDPEEAVVWVRCEEWPPGIKEAFTVTARREWTYRAERGPVCELVAGGFEMNATITVEHGSADLQLTFDVEMGTWQWHGDPDTIPHGDQAAMLERAKTLIPADEALYGGQARGGQVARAARRTEVMIQLSPDLAVNPAHVTRCGLSADGEMWIHTVGGYQIGEPVDLDRAAALLSTDRDTAHAAILAALGCGVARSSVLHFAVIVDAVQGGRLGEE